MKYAQANDWYTSNLHKDYKSAASQSQNASASAHMYSCIAYVHVYKNAHTHRQIDNLSK